MLQSKTLYQNLKELEVMTAGKLRPKTIDTYFYSLRIIRTLFQDKQMDLFEISEIQQSFLVMADMGYSKSQIHQIRVLLSKAFKINNAKTKSVWNPIPDTYIPKEAPEQTIDALTVKEQRDVEEACKTDMYGHLFLFLLYSGLRSEELRNMKWEDYSKASGVLNIPSSKTAAGVRNIPLLPICRTIIELQPKTSEYIFTSRRGTPITVSILRKTYLRLRKVTEVSTLTNHVCRHTFATRLIEANISKKAVSAILGHTSVSFTMDRYVSVQMPFLQTQLAKFANNFDGCRLAPSCLPSCTPEGQIEGQMSLL